MHILRPPFRRHECGNALFLILLAVVLFAALSYAIMQTNRSSGSVGRDKMETDYARISSILNAAVTEITRLRLAGCTLDEIHQAPGTPSSNSRCNFWGTDGGGFLFSPDGPPPLQLYPGMLRNIGDDTKPDIAILAVLDDTPANETLCLFFDEKNHITHTIDKGAQPFESSSANWDESMLNTSGGPSIFGPEFAGKTQGCAYDGAMGSYVIYGVIEEH